MEVMGRLVYKQGLILEMAGLSWRELSCRPWILREGSKKEFGGDHCGGYVPLADSFTSNKFVTQQKNKIQISQLWDLIETWGFREDIKDVKGIGLTLVPNSKF